MRRPNAASKRALRIFPYSRVLHQDRAADLGHHPRDKQDQNPAQSPQHDRPPRAFSRRAANSSSVFSGEIETGVTTLSIDQCTSCNMRLHRARLGRCSKVRTIPRTPLMKSSFA